MKWSARCKRLCICLGSSRDCTSAIALTTDTHILCSGHSSSWLTVLHSFVLLGNFSRMYINAHLAGQRNIVPSTAAINRGTTQRLYVLTASCMWISGWLLQIMITWANRFLSSCNSTVSQAHETLIFLAQWISKSGTSVSSMETIDWSSLTGNDLWLMSNKIFLNFIQYYNHCYKFKELVALLGETFYDGVPCLLFARKQWGRQGMMMGATIAVVVSANSLVSSARHANSGVTRKNFVWAFGFKVIPSRVAVVKKQNLLRLSWTN